jgi:hypothetical protein
LLAVSDYLKREFLHKDENRMKQLGGVEEVYSALYVDFDNIYTRLAEQDAELGRAFGAMPHRWVRWVEMHALRILYGEGVRRRILKRMCYMNPQCYQEFRPFFIRAAFQVVDCPPLTQQGKTSADIHLVMDCMDDLSHSTRFEEFIILSGDADFTPMLIRLQEHARRTLVLSVGYAAPAYTAAASWRIREDWFIQQALMDDSRESASADVVRNQDSFRPREKNRRVAEQVKRIVSEASAPLTFQKLEQSLRMNKDLAGDLNGEGAFPAMLEQMDLGALEISRLGEGHVYDPVRHEPPGAAAEREAFRQTFPDMFKLALTLHRLTDIPLLKPESWNVLLAELAEEVRLNPYSLRGTIKNVRERCLVKELPLTGRDIAWLLETLAQGGCRLRERRDITRRDLGKALLLGMQTLCRSAQLRLEQQELQLLMEWLIPRTGPNRGDME